MQGQLQAMQGVFPNANPESLLHVLRESDGNMDDAAEKLLNSTEGGTGAYGIPYRTKLHKQ